MNSRERLEERLNIELDGLYQHISFLEEFGDKSAITAVQAQIEELKEALARL